ncbi:hypothetical protein ONZ45_g116 [Pleurotus djamor]|nr:hypothetical protein ONZ45_g116 [Pleurotus djamor]
MLGSPYVVHELRSKDDPRDDEAVPCNLHTAELPTGRNFMQGTDGTWGDIYTDAAVSVAAAPIYHSVPCVGFVVTEAPVPGKMDPKKYVPELKRTKAPMTLMSRLQQGESVTLPDGTVLEGPRRRPGRKIAILGDTYDASPIEPLATDADILIHEATNAHLLGIDPNTKETDTQEIVEERSRSRGHSTPQVAGAFATRIRAKKLLLNHFSARYPGDDDVDDESKKIMDGIRALAQERFAGEVICARDFMSIDCKLSDIGE